MSETPPSDGAPGPEARNEPPVLPADLRPVVTTGGDGCAFLAGVFGGFVLFVALGWVVLAGTRSQAVGVAYLVAAFAGAIWLTTKPGLRGLAIGIFLGLGAWLLLLAICSGMKF